MMLILALSLWVHAFLVSVTLSGNVQYVVTLSLFFHASRRNIGCVMDVRSYAWT